jgi:hypothetical protein
MNANILSKLQPRQIEWLYWLSQGQNKYGASDKMGLSNKSIPLRQKRIRQGTCRGLPQKRRDAFWNFFVIVDQTGMGRPW